MKAKLLRKLRKKIQLHYNTTTNKFYLKENGKYREILMGAKWHWNGRRIYALRVYRKTIIKEAKRRTKPKMIKLS